MVLLSFSDITNQYISFYLLKFCKSYMKNSFDYQHTSQQVMAIQALFPWNPYNMLSSCADFMIPLCNSLDFIDKMLIASTQFFWP